jgi:hypothetical protein
MGGAARWRVPQGQLRAVTTGTSPGRRQRFGAAPAHPLHLQPTIAAYTSGSERLAVDAAELIHNPAAASHRTVSRGAPSG